MVVSIKQLGKRQAIAPFDFSDNFHIRSFFHLTKHIAANITSKSKKSIFPVVLSPLSNSLWYFGTKLTKNTIVFWHEKRNNPRVVCSTPKERDLSDYLASGLLGMGATQVDLRLAAAMGSWK